MYQWIQMCLYLVQWVSFHTLPSQIFVQMFLSFCSMLLLCSFFIMAAACCVALCAQINDTGQTHTSSSDTPFALSDNLCMVIEHFQVAAQCFFLGLHCVSDIPFIPVVFVNSVQ